MFVLNKSFSQLLYISPKKKQKNEAKEPKGGFLGILWGTLCASLFENILAWKDVLRAGEGTFRAGQIFDAA